MSLSNLLLLNQQLVIQGLVGQEFISLVAQIRSELAYNEFRNEHTIYAKSCDFEGTDFTGIDLTGIVFESCYFNNCIFDEKSFFSILRAIKGKVVLNDCNIDVDLSRILKVSGGIAVYSGAHCEGLKARGCTFTKDARGALLTGSLLEYCKFQGNAANIILNYCDLLGSQFNCNLTNAKIKFANLQNVSFKGSTLEGAVFDGSNISGADFKGTGITAAQLVNAKGWEKAIFDNQEQMLSEIYALKKGNTLQQITEIVMFLAQITKDEIDKIRQKFIKKSINTSTTSIVNQEFQPLQPVTSDDKAIPDTIRSLTPENTKVLERAAYLRGILSKQQSIKSHESEVDNLAEKVVKPDKAKNSEAARAA